MQPAVPTVDEINESPLLGKGSSTRIKLPGDASFFLTQPETEGRVQGWANYHPLNSAHYAIGD